MNYNTSASSINLNIKSDIYKKPDHGESIKCSGCGRDLYWYGELQERAFISSGWHRMGYAQGSYDFTLCDNCCREHSKNIGK
jgi:hypothetical protein